jgi:hypothetical protein
LGCARATALPTVQLDLTDLSTAASGGVLELVSGVRPNRALRDWMLALLWRFGSGLVLPMPAWRLSIAGALRAMRDQVLAPRCQLAQISD